jgi:hypothetical protein
MNKKLRLLFLISLLLVIVYSFFGLNQLSKPGGPCNGGLALLVWGPGLFLGSVLQLIVFKQMTSPVIKSSLFWLAISFLCTVVCSYGIIVFAEEKNAVLYQSPFLIMNIFVTIIALRARVKEEDNSPG